VGRDSGTIERRSITFYRGHGLPRGTISSMPTPLMSTTSRHNGDVAIRKKPVILRCHRAGTMRLRKCNSRTRQNRAIVATSSGSALRANLAQKRPVPSLEEFNDGDSIEVVRREIAQQVDGSVEGRCSARQDQ
jgi:hypothetical protein